MQLDEPPQDLFELTVLGFPGLRIDPVRKGFQGTLDHGSGTGRAGSGSDMGGPDLPLGGVLIQGYRGHTPATDFLPSPPRGSSGLPRNARTWKKPEGPQVPAGPPAN
ncbi:hypothetical protein GCM10009636_18240 [Arthrobacter koreensis]